MGRARHWAPQGPRRALLAAALLALSLAVPAQAEDTPPAVDVAALNLRARIDTGVFPPRGKKPYKKGERVVYTIWIDNDDPYDGMRDVLIHMPELPPGERLDLSPDQPAYGNIFYDSRLPRRSDTPATCNLYYTSKPEPKPSSDSGVVINYTPRPGGDTRRLTVETPPENIRHIMWVCARADGGEVIGPHDGNENMYGREKADVRFHATVDRDEMYVRYAVIIEDKPRKKK